MKMVKSLLLGSAAGLVAVAGAQAADLPVKAKPVEYVKICTIYGAGFYYIPGTDTCIKIGGYLRAEVDVYASGSHSPYLAGGQARHDRQDTDVWQSRVRAVVSFDTRTETEYGTLRSYIRAGWQHTTGSTATTSNTASFGGQVTAPYFDRGFIQFAGFTIGRTQSFWDFFNAVGFYYYGNFMASDTGGGINLIAYTAQFGGGFSATISLEEPGQRRVGLLDATSSGLPIGGNAGQALDYRGYIWPDVQGILRVDQPWGSAQVAGVVRDISAGYYFPNFQNFPPPHPHGSQWPGNKVGWAVEGGLSINLPWATGDKFAVEAAYGQGAMNYVSNVTNVGWFRPENCGNRGAVGCASLAWGFDAVFAGAPSLVPGSGSSLELTRAWSVKAGIEHYWTPALRTSVFGGYERVNYNDQASAQICGILLAAATTRGAVCNPDHNIWQVGARTIWNPVRNLDVGLEVVYMKLDQKNAGNFLLAPGGAKFPGPYTLEDADIWTGIVRFQRNFWP